nr:exocyst complex component EXO70A1-like [Ipomoea batatas]
MVEDVGGTPFQAVFFDGEQEIGIGDPQVDRRKNSDHTREGELSRSSSLREKDCYFLAVLKRSRKSRNRKAKMNGGGGAVVDYGDYLSENDFAVSPQPENLILLRRNQPEMSVNMIRNVDPIQRENYAMAMARTNPNLMHLAIPSPNLELDPNNFPRIEDTYWTITAKTEGTTSTCKECMNAKNGKPAAFHPCVNDPVIKGWFRSRAGPIRTHSIRRAHENIDKTLKATELILSQFDLARQAEAKILRGPHEYLESYLEACDQLRGVIKFFGSNKNFKGGVSVISHATTLLNKSVG